MTDPELGQTVLTPDGKEGIVLAHIDHGALKFFHHRGPRSRKAVYVWAVHLEDGEVRFFTADALRDPNEGSPDIRRSGSLK